MVDGLVVGTLLVGIVPPHVVLRVLVFHDIFVFGRTAGEDAGIDGKGTRFSPVGLVITSQCRICFLFMLLVVSQMVVNLNRVFNAQRLQFSS